MTDRDSQRASVVSAPMAKKLKSSMYECTVVGNISGGDVEGVEEKARKTREE